MTYPKKIHLRNGYACRQAQAAIKRAFDAGDLPLVVTLEKPAERSTDLMRRAFFGWAKIIGDELGYSPGEMKVVLFEGCFGLKEMTLPSGRVVALEPSWSKLTKDEARTLLDYTDRIAAENSIRLPTSAEYT